MPRLLTVDEINAKLKDARDEVREYTNKMNASKTKEGKEKWKRALKGAQESVDGFTWMLKNKKIKSTEKAPDKKPTKEKSKEKSLTVDEIKKRIKQFQYAANSVKLDMEDNGFSKEGKEDLDSHLASIKKYKDMLKSMNESYKISFREYVTEAVKNTKVTRAN